MERHAPPLLCAQTTAPDHIRVELIDAETKRRLRVLDQNNSKISHKVLVTSTPEHLPLSQISKRLRSWRLHLIRKVLDPISRWLALFLAGASSVLKTHVALQLEKVALRHQIGVLQRSAKQRHGCSQPTDACGSGCPASGRQVLGRWRLLRLRPTTPTQEQSCAWLLLASTLRAWAHHCLRRASVIAEVRWRRQRFLYVTRSAWR